MTKHFPKPSGWRWAEWPKSHRRALLPSSDKSTFSAANERFLTGQFPFFFFPPLSGHNTKPKAHRATFLSPNQGLLFLWSVTGSSTITIPVILYPTDEVAWANSLSEQLDNRKRWQISQYSDNAQLYRTKLSSNLKRRAENVVNFRHSQ